MRGLIYKIRCNVTSKCYVGSTTRTLNTRMSQHRYDKRCLSREVTENNDYAMEVLEEREFETREALLWCERQWTEQTQNCVNKQRAIVTEEERVVENLERCRKYKAAHREEHIEYYREYNAAHREELNAKSREYHANHRDEKNTKCRERNSVRFTCGCGAEVSKGDLSRHRKSKKHLDKIAAKNIDAANTQTETPDAS